MAASDLVSVRGQVMEYMYIPTRIKGEMVRSGVDSHWKGQVVATVGRRLVAIFGIFVLWCQYLHCGIVSKMLYVKFLSV